MQRTRFADLADWIHTKNRKPLVLRGARQVGKTWLVRHLAKAHQKELIELNFEKQHALQSLFNSNDPQQILLNLSTKNQKKIEPSKTLLFLDEIQAAPELLAKLRWFAEDLPELAVIAAGSLLEFTLAEHTFSMPVGRINYMYLEPLSFEEFLLAQDKTALYDYLQTLHLTTEIPALIHTQFMQLFKEFLLVGGMPAAVSSWQKERDFNKINQIHHDLLATYRDDFNKYKGHCDKSRLDEVMSAIPRLLGKKFMYSQVNSETTSSSLKQALNLLEKARVSHRVQSTHAQGLPLGSNIHEKYFKEIFLDAGLCSAMLGLGLNQMNLTDEITFINNGGLAEQIVGQLLKTIPPAYIEPDLYCWHREVAGSNAEIDYVIQHANQIIPIEVKAGKTGTLKSLHNFMGIKKYTLAIRINSDFPSKTPVSVKDHTGTPITYTLLSIPFYLIGQLHRLIHEIKI